MSGHLWKAFYEDDVDTFRLLLEAAVSNNTRSHHAGRAGLTSFSTTSANNSSAILGGSSLSPHGGSYGALTVGSPPLATTPTVPSSKSRRSAGPNGNGSFVLTKADINARDAYGRTLLHHVVSVTTGQAVAFATALIEHPYIDLYMQDAESGWTALHRAFYFGNVTVARMMLERDANDVLGKTNGPAHQTLGLVKVKDKEGLGPLDLYAATIKDRTLRPEISRRQRSGSTGSDEDRAHIEGGEFELHRSFHHGYINIDGDQLFTFGSNRNITLGFGDEDDRQFPERINLRRPQHLLRRFYKEFLEQEDPKWTAYDSRHEPKAISTADMWIEDIPWVARSRPIVIRDVRMSKLASAILTTDPECNLYMCGHGQGGRLGTGDERTRFNFVCIEGGALAGKRVASVALGVNHTLALSDEGEIFSWGNNGFGQLGYTLPKTNAKDEDPISTVPRQIFGPLKREVVVGIAASRIHSVVHTSTALYTFGKNEGQLGIVDSDARSLVFQNTPRRVAASLFTSSILAVTAIEKATVCLLENHDVWVFANYGYAKVQFPLEGSSSHFLNQSFFVTCYDHEPNRISKITSEGDTICALSSRGEIFTLSISQRPDNQLTASTTNPSKIRSAITPPQCIWSPKKGNMAARDVGVDADGSIILSTEEGSVWKRTKRATIKDTAVTATSEYKPKDYKFSRIPALTRVLAVRSSGHGAYAAVRRDCNVLKTQLVVEDSTLWKDIFSLCPLQDVVQETPDDPDDLKHRFWQGTQRPSAVSVLKKTILRSVDIEADLQTHFEGGARSEEVFDAILTTTTSDLQIPLHRFLLTGRSRVLRRGFRDLCKASTFTIPDLAICELDDLGRAVIRFQGVDILTVIDLVFYLYSDAVVDLWHFTKDAATMAHRYRQVRIELMKIATKFELARLEPAARQMGEPRLSLDMDLAMAFTDSAFFHDGDILVQLEDDEVRVHSALVCARCPFFEGLFMGRAGGRWLAGRGGEEDSIRVDLEHINSNIFRMVLQHIYSDAGEEIFDEVVSMDLDDFLDTVMDVMAAANELMLDRLSQIAQAVIGRFVNVRNVCGLLNAISPSSVREFKDAGLEYLCLNLEAMLQGHYLNELDEDLLGELDEVIRQNQLACMPFAKSGRAELQLHERHPGLAGVLDRNRQARIDSVTLRAKFQDVNSFVPGSLGDDLSISPLQQKSRRRSSAAHRNELDRPPLKAKASSKDMMFEMDEESDFNPLSPRESPAIRPMMSPRGLDPIPQETPPEEVWYNSRGKVLPSPRLAPQSYASGSTTTPRTPRSPPMMGRAAPGSGSPWTFTPLPTSRTDMKDIMAQAASSNRTSSLSQGLANTARSPLPEIPLQPPAPFSLPAPKMSQKDRKRLQHAQQATSSAVVTGSPATPTQPETSPIAWRAVGGTRKTSFKDLMQGEVNKPSASKTAPPTRSVGTPQLTMRQTVANSKSTSTKPSLDPGSTAPLSATPSKSYQQSFRHPSSPITAAANNTAAAAMLDASAAGFLGAGLSMSEILAQQQLEKDIIKEAVAKRDLQEIQAEQEFQEWWDKESRRVQEAEARSAATGDKAANGSNGNKGPGQARSGRRRRDAAAIAAANGAGKVGSPASSLTPANTNTGTIAAGNSPGQQTPHHGRRHRQQQAKGGNPSSTSDPSSRGGSKHADHPAKSHQGSERQHGSSGDRVKVK